MNTFKNQHAFLKSLLLHVYTIIFIGYFSCAFATDQESTDPLGSKLNYSSVQASSFTDEFKSAETSFKNLLIQTPVLENKIENSQECYEQGRHYQTLNNIDLACEWYERASFYDHPDALFELGKLKGSTGLLYTERAAALDHKIALYHLALIKSSLKDINGTQQLMMKSSELGYAPAQCFIGKAYLEYYENLVAGKYKTITTDNYLEELKFAKNQAMNWLMRSALQSYEEAELKCNEFLTKNNIPFEICMTWYAKAAQDQGAVSYFNLGLKYLILSRNDFSLNHLKQFFENQAIEWLVKAADQDHFGAQFELVCVYEQKQRSDQFLEVSINNNSMIINNEQYLNYLIKIANQDVNILQKTYTNARDVIIISIKKLSDHYLAATQYQESIKWLYKAAALDDVEAFYNLGVHHQEGAIIPQNKELAASFYTKAMQLGDPDAASKLRYLLAASTQPKFPRYF